MKKYFLVTGGTSGIGFEIVQLLAEHKSHIWVLARNAEKFKKLYRQPNIQLIHGDLQNLDSILLAIEKLKQEQPDLIFDAVIHNAAVMKRKDCKTQDGYSETEQVNHIAPLFLTKVLLHKNLLSNDCLIFWLSSNAHHFGPLLNLFPQWMQKSSSTLFMWLRYAHSKHATLLCEKSLTELLQREGGIHRRQIFYTPGATDTPIQDAYPRVLSQFIRYFSISPKRAALQIVQLLNGRSKKRI